MKESILWPILQQARIHATNGFNFDVDKFHNKFAELIVRECAKKADQIENYIKTDNSCGDYLKKHFGVDEE